MPEIWSRKILEDFQASQVKSNLADNAEELCFLKEIVERVRRCWSPREPMRRASSKYKELRGSWHIKYFPPSISWWGKRNLWGLCPTSLFLSSFLWVQIPCTRKIPHRKLHDPAVPPLHNGILPDVINRHFMNSPNNFQCSNFTSLKTSTTFADSRLCQAASETLVAGQSRDQALGWIMLPVRKQEGIPKGASQDFSSVLAWFSVHGWFIQFSHDWTA